MEPSNELAPGEREEPLEPSPGGDLAAGETEEPIGGAPAASATGLPAGIPTAEQEALKPAGLLVPLERFAQKHPYIAAAGMGVMGGPPGWAEDLGMAAPVVGAAEQMGYQGLTNLAAKIGGPYAGLVAAFGLPGLGRGAARLMTSVPSGIEQARTAATAAQETLQTTAETAATAQETKNLAERAKAVEDVAKEAKKGHEQISAAASKQGDANMKQLANAHETARQHLSDFKDKLDEHRQSLETTKAGVEKRVGKQAAASEAERQRAAMLQRTPEQSAAAMAPAPVDEGGVSVPSPEQLQRTRDFQGSYSSARGKLAGHYGGQYDDFENRFGTSKSPATALQEPVNKWRGVLNERDPQNQPSAPIKGLLARAENMSYGGVVPQGPEDVISPRDWAKMSPTVRESATRFWQRTVSDPKELNSGKALFAYPRADGTTELLDPKKALSGPRAGEPNVIQLRAIATEAERLANSASNDRDALIASDVADGATRSLEEAEGVSKPELAKLRTLNSQYRDFKSTWPTSLGRKVSATNEPAKVIEGMVKDPKLMRQWAANATPAEQQTVRNALTDWANDKHLSLAQIGQQVDPAVLKDFGFNLPKEAWLKMEPKDIELSTVLNDSPLAQREFGSEFQREYGRIEQRKALQLKREVIKTSRALKGPGRVFEERVQAARTPAEIQQVADDLAAYQPREAASSLARTQQTPASAAYEAALGRGPGTGTPARPGLPPRVVSPARQALQDLPGKQTSPEQAAIEAIQGLPTSREAAIQKLQTLQPGKGEQYLTRAGKVRGWFYGGSILGAEVMGHNIPGYAFGAAIIDAAVMGLGSGPRGLSRLVLRNPKIAELAWDALKQPRTVGGLRRSARAAAGILAALQEQHLEEGGNAPAAPAPATPPPEAATPAPTATPSPTPTATPTPAATPTPGSLDDARKALGL